MSNEYLIKKFKHKNKNEFIEIHQDTDPESPRTWDNLGIMICAHKRYELGDIQIKSEDELNEHLKNAVIKMPLFLMDHSGLSISCSDFSDKLDSGQLGYITLTKEKLLKEYTRKRLSKKLIEKAKQSLLSEVDVYNDYLMGSVYGYVHYKTKKCNMQDDHKIDLDSCWGYFGDLDKSGIYENFDMTKFKEIYSC